VKNCQSLKPQFINPPQLLPFNPPQLLPFNPHQLLPTNSPQHLQFNPFQLLPINPPQLFPLFPLEPNHNHPLSVYTTWPQLNTELERIYGLQYTVRKVDRIASDIQFLESFIQQESMNENSAFKNELDLVQLWIEKLKYSETQ
jgi:hypothetical protein